MKALLFLPLLVMSVWITGCTKKYEYVTPNQTIQTDIAASDWKLLNDGKSYGVTISMPEITDRVNQEFGIVVSVSGDGGTFEAIPEVYAGYSYSYTHTVGSLTIESQAVSGTAGTPPPAVTVKIVLVESQP